MMLKFKLVLMRLLLGYFSLHLQFSIRYVCLFLSLLYRIFFNVSLCSFQVFFHGSFFSGEIRGRKNWKDAIKLILPYWFFITDKEKILC